jgi:protease PrsW
MVWGLALLGVAVALYAPAVLGQDETPPAQALADDPVMLYAIVIAAAFLPPIIYVIVIRNVERLNREPWSAILRAFFYGAVFSVLIAIVLEIAFASQFAREYQLTGGKFTITQQALLIIVAAPLVEEFAKGLGVRSVRKNIFEVEDGIVYGAAAGLGFSATENLIYELGTIYQQTTPGPDGTVPGLDWTFLAVAALRSVTSSFLHGTASGILGYGMGKRYLDRGPLIDVLPYYALAVLVHAVFNAMAAFVTFTGAVFLIIFISILAISWTVNRIRRLDRAGAIAPYR